MRNCISGNNNPVPDLWLCQRYGKSEYGAGFDNATYDGSVQIKDVKISWTIEIDGNVLLAQDMLLAD